MTTRTYPPRAFPSRSRRGLGLFDSIVAFAVFSLALLWGSQMLGNWIAGQAISNEARTVADLARAGRLLIEGDINHSGRSHAEGAAPLSIDFDDLEDAGLRAPALGERTPGRRTLSLWLYRPPQSQNVLLIMARARGDQPVGRVPGTENGVSGVGVLLSGETALRGPGVAYDMADINTLQSGFATTNDIFALDYVALEVTCRSYLYRIETDCDGDGAPNPEVNVMTADLDMADNDITGVSEITADTAQIGRLDGDTRIEGDLSVGGDLEVNGTTTLSGNMTLEGTLSAQNATIEDALTVQDQLRVEGTLTGQTLTFDGEATVSGAARIGTLNITSMTTEELRADRIDIETGEITDLRAEDLTVTTCSGCNP